MVGGRRPSRASIVVSTYSTIFEDRETETETGETASDIFPHSEVSETFTIVKRGSSLTLGPSHDTTAGGEDTEAEEDDEFDEYSEVTFEEPRESLPFIVRRRKEPLFNQKAAHSGHGHRLAKSCHGPSSPSGLRVASGQGTCHCALTYNNAREKRRRAVSMAQQSKNVHSGSEDTSLSSESEEWSRLGKVRKKSKYGPCEPEEPKLVEGVWKLEANRNFSRYLDVIGTGPCSQDMVMRAAVTLTVTQDPDKQWRISSETAIKAKSVRGYRTSNRKWTENKFKSGEAKPELLDDWDQRLVVTTLTVEEEGARIQLLQVAEKDQTQCCDSILCMDVDPLEPDILVLTYMVEGVTAWRRFLRHAPTKAPGARKISAPF